MRVAVRFRVFCAAKCAAGCAGTCRDVSSACDYAGYFRLRTVAFQNFSGSLYGNMLAINGSVSPQFTRPGGYEHMLSLMVIPTMMIVAWFAVTVVEL